MSGGPPRRHVKMQPVMLRIVAALAAEVEWRMRKQVALDFDVKSSAWLYGARDHYVGDRPSPFIVRPVSCVALRLLRQRSVFLPSTKVPSIKMNRSAAIHRMDAA